MTHAVLPAVPTCTVTAHVSGGLESALKVVSMLHGRRYVVRDLGVQVGADRSSVTCTALVTSAERDLLLARLRRLPVVVSAGSA